MSSLWTPEGEHRVSQPTSPPASAPAPPPAPPGPSAPGDPSEPPDAPDVEALREQLAATPVAVVIVNHCLGMWELAALHLSQQPPNLDQAAVAIDAVGAIVERLEGRLGEDEATLKDALAQIRVAFVQIKSAAPDD